MQNLTDKFVAQIHRATSFAVVTSSGNPATGNLGTTTSLGKLCPANLLSALPILNFCEELSRSSGPLHGRLTAAEPGYRKKQLSVRLRYSLVVSQALQASLYGIIGRDVGHVTCPRALHFVRPCQPRGYCVIRCVV